MAANKDRAMRRKHFARRMKRVVLMIILPLCVAVAALYVYANGGRYIVTENAYVKANVIAVSADVSGRVIAVDIHDNRVVKPGDRLFAIDPVPFRIDLAEADAQLEIIRTDVGQLRYDIAEAQAELAEARERQRFLAQQFERQKKLKQRGMGSEEAYDHALHDLKAGEETMRTIDQRIARSLAAHGNDPNMPVDKHPRFRHAMAVREQALVDLGHTVVRAPAKGVISNMKLQVGEYVKAGDPVFSLIEAAPIWIEANLKETELTNLNIGQPATVVVDAYPDHEWWAFVDTIAPATGAEFALLPPQNATGNWVKVVQRVPVALRIEPSGDDPVLRAGMTVTVSIDTGKTRGLTDIVPEPIANLRLPDFLRRALALDRPDH
jgi:membrane fusion protein (multidrug efflux system)